MIPLKDIRNKYALTEAKSGQSLTIFDIDETLFHTSALIAVKDQNGNVISRLTNWQFNTYTLKPGESFDFGEFKNAEKFNRESEPIRPMIAKLKAIINNNKGGRIIFLTAREDFDDKHLFLSTFRKYGIDMDKVYVHRAGNLKTGTISQKKVKIINSYLETGVYGRARLYDDAERNVIEFLNMKREYPSIDFEGYLVLKNGAIKRL